MLEVLQNLINNSSFKVLIIVIVLDTIFGILRAIKEKNVNSCIGIDGIIRKVGMMLSVIFLSMIDNIVHIDLIGFIPVDIKELLNLGKIGIMELFTIIFTVFEILSIFKNMILCKLPIPKKLQDILEKAMNEFTGEIKKENVTVISGADVKIDAPQKVEIKNKEGE